jgi:steroid 5-alpha reductase family enzyme
MWNLKKEEGKSLFADFLGIHFFPTAMVFALCLPLYPAPVETVNEVTVSDLPAFATSLSGLAVETVADGHLRLFKERIKRPPEFEPASGLFG